MHPFFFFFNDTATTEIYTLSLHDALPIWPWICPAAAPELGPSRPRCLRNRLCDPPGWSPELRNHTNFFGGIGTPDAPRRRDRKSTRLNSSHDQISYAVFCLKKKKGCQQGPHSCYRPVAFCLCCTS